MAETMMIKSYKVWFVLGVVFLVTFNVSGQDTIFLNINSFVYDSCARKLSFEINLGEKIPVRNNRLYTKSSGIFTKNEDKGNSVSYVEYEDFFFMNDTIVISSLNPCYNVYSTTAHGQGKTTFVFEDLNEIIHLNDLVKFVFYSVDKCPSDIILPVKFEKNSPERTHVFFKISGS